MPVTDFKALRCQSARQMACAGEAHSWHWAHAGLKESQPAPRRPPRRGRPPPCWPPPADGWYGNLCACSALALQGDTCARRPGLREPVCENPNPSREPGHVQQAAPPRAGLCRSPLYLSRAGALGVCGCVRIGRAPLHGKSTSGRGNSGFFRAGGDYSHTLWHAGGRGPAFGLYRIAGVRIRRLSTG